MSESSAQLKGAEQVMGPLNDPITTFQKMQDLLRAKDDTSRFVGLALLKTVLDNGQLINDPQRLRVLWDALSPKFLDRLLRARQNEKVSKSDSKDMVDLAVAVLHTFSILLSEEARREKRLTERIAPLVKALIQSPPETTKLILQTILTIVSLPEGALEILAIEDLSSLIEISNQYPLVLDILGFSWTNASTINAEVEAVRKSINQVIPALIINFKGTDAVTFIGFVGNIIPKLDPEAVPRNPKWLPPLILMLRKLVASKPTATGRAAYTQLAATLLQAYPATCPSLLFKHDASGNADSKPFSYLLINLLLIDVRSSFPSLLAKLNSDEYPAVSQRLAAAFDVISNFIGFLVRSLDDESVSAFSMTPDLLLKLRRDIAETMSLNIEYLRDRWDASIAGTSGLHPSARSGTAATSEGTRLTLTWESMKDNVNADPLILAGIRALAIWIREDENENLRNETAGLMDMFMDLYKSSLHSTLDFRYPILLALEGIMINEEGIDGFLGQDGWLVVFEDLKSILKTANEQPTISQSSAEAGRGLQIVRVLLAIIDHEATSFPREDWMAVVTTTTSMHVTATAASPVVLEFYIAMLQLASALLSQSSGGMTKRYITSLPALSGLVKQLKALVKNMNDEAESSELMGLLDDVALDLENLR
ncbi:Neurochondrin-domain-containing protein [Rhexocercosporidium sp. MPI-PUGE-AT-0058]|nr:Neurochondrin-domain-containing protein [Rhexocercosporidium sp. MPI-PUGE-AT-0058]